MAVSKETRMERELLPTLLEINTKLATVIEQSRATNELVTKLVESDGNNRSRIQSLEYKQDSLNHIVSNVQADVAVLKTEVGGLSEDKRFRKRTIAWIMAAASAFAAVTAFLVSFYFQVKTQ